MTSPNWSFEKKVKFWAFLGPMLFMVTLLVGLFRARPESLYLHLIGVLCLPICIRWKKEGLYASMGLLFFGILLTYFIASPATFMWQSGLALAVATSFIVTTLSFDEVETLTDSLVLEAQSRLKSMLAIDEKYKNNKVAWERERQEFEIKMDTLATEHRELEGLFHTKGEELHQLKNTLQEVRTEASKLEKEITLTQSQLEEKEKLLLETIREKDELNQRTIDLGKAFARNPEVETLRTELSETKTYLDKILSEKQQLAKSFEAIKLEQQNLEENNVSTDELNRALEREEQHLRQLKRCQGMLSQLQEQFAEKSEILAQTRTELFEKEGELHVAKKELEEFKKISLHHLQKKVDNYLKKQIDEDPSEEIERLHHLVETLMQELAVLKAENR